MASTRDRFLAGIRLGRGRARGSQVLGSLAVAAASTLLTAVAVGAGLYLARMLPTAEFGRVAVAQNALLIFAIVAGLGLSVGVTAQVARRSGHPADDAAAWASASTLLTIRLISIGILLGVGVLLAAASGERLLLLAAAGAAGFILQDFLVGIYQGLLLPYAVASITALQPLTYLVLLVLLPPASAEAVIGLQVIAFVPGLVLAAFLLRRHRVPLGLSLARAGGAAGHVGVTGVTGLGAHLRGALALSGHSYLLTFLQVAFLSLPLVWLGALDRYEEAAALSVLLALTRLPAAIAGPVLSAVYFPRLQAYGHPTGRPTGHPMDSRAGARAGGAAALVLRYAAALGAGSAVAAACLAALAGPVLHVLFGGRYDPLAATLPAASLLIPSLTLEALLTWTLLSAGRGLHAAGALAARLIAVLGSCLLLPRLAPDASTALNLLVAAHVVAAGMCVGIEVALLLRSGLPAAGRPPSSRAGMLAAGAVFLVLAAAAAPAVARAQPQPPGAAPPLSRSCVVAGSRGRALEVRCEPGLAGPRDTVLVYGGGRAGGEAPRPGTPWQPLMRDETWVIESGAEGRASLIIAFRPDGADTIASIYDDENGDGAVTYRLTSGPPQVSESFGHPALRVRARGGWWYRDGRPNFNLDLAVDGRILGMIDYPLYGDYLRTDGVPDLVVHVRDRWGRGRPTYEWRQAHPPLDDDAGYYHTSIMVNTLDDEPPLDPTPFPWPYIGPESYLLVKPYFRSPPPIQVNWTRGRIVSLGEFVASRGKSGNYFVYSIARVDERRVTATNFENPFAFYNLAGEPAAYPDLALRFVHFPAGDPYLGLAPPTQQVDYSWRHAGLAGPDGPIWDYKVSLAGRHPIETAVSIDSFAVKIVPYEDLPRWVRDREWDFATLVAREGAGYQSTEGLYEWYPLEGADPQARRYLVGMGARPPEDAFTDIIPEHRAERTFALGARATLYFGPVDRKLHLRGATEGVWRLDEQRRLRYWDRDADGEIDEWRYEAPDEAVRRLRLLTGLALYAEGEHVELRTVPPDAHAALFEVDLPATGEQWHALGERLRAAPAAEWHPADLRAMLDRLPIPDGAARAAGPARVRLTGGAVEQERATAEGVRIVLRIESGASLDVEGTALDALRGLPPGSYECLYSAALGLQVRPLTPAAVSVDVRLAAVPPAGIAGITALDPLPLSVRIANTGGADVLGAHVRLLASRAGGPPLSVVSATVDLPGESERHVRTAWAPPAPGDWTLRAEITWAGAAPAAPGAATPVAQRALTVAVQPAHAAELPGGRGPALAGLAPLLPFAAGAALAAVLLRVLAGGRPAGPRGPDTRWGA